MGEGARALYAPLKYAPAATSRQDRRDRQLNRTCYRRYAVRKYKWTVRLFIAVFRKYESVESFNNDGFLVLLRNDDSVDNCAF